METPGWLATCLIVKFSGVGGKPLAKAWRAKMTAVQPSDIALIVKKKQLTRCEIQIERGLLMNEEKTAVSINPSISTSDQGRTN